MSYEQETKRCAALLVSGQIHSWPFVVIENLIKG